MQVVRSTRSLSALGVSCYGHAAMGYAAGLTCRAGTGGVVHACGAEVVRTIARFWFGLRGSASRAPLVGVVAIVRLGQRRRRRVGHGRGGGRDISRRGLMWVLSGNLLVSESDGPSTILSNAHPAQRPQVLRTCKASAAVTRYTGYYNKTLFGLGHQRVGRATAAVRDRELGCRGRGRDNRRDPSSHSFRVN